MTLGGAQNKVFCPAKPLGLFALLPPPSSRRACKEGWHHRWAAVLPLPQRSARLCSRCSHPRPREKQRPAL
jgi:hypothetical protein